MSLSAAEKLAVVRMVEESELPVKRTLAELGVSRSSFYRWYRYYLDDGPASPAYILMQAGDSFQNPTRRVNELWQTDFTYFRVVGWGWYYLSTVLDDYSRYIIAWKLTTSMAADDVRNPADREHSFRLNVNTDSGSS